MMRRLAVLFTMLLTASTALGQEKAIPTPDAFLGYSLGERFTPYARILDYFDELARRSDLVSVERFGESYEHRPLVLVVITSKKNRAALESIRNDVASLSDAEATTPARAQEIAASRPAIAWLGFGVHGNESSSAEASMLVASTLLHDPASATILENVVVLIDPLQNLTVASVTSSGSSAPAERRPTPTPSPSSTTSRGPVAAPIPTSST
jgi:Zinc carboxypeptidase.